MRLSKTSRLLALARPGLLLAALTTGGLLSTSALAQDDEPEAETGDRQFPPASLQGSGMRKLDFVDRPLSDIVTFMFDLRRENYILGDNVSLKEKVTIVSHTMVTPAAAWQAFLSALERHNYTLVKTGSYYKIIKASEGVQAPLQVRTGDTAIPYSDQVITQLLPLDNISANDVQSVVNALKSANGKIIVYQPSNTLIITDHAYNVRKIAQLLAELDVGSPRSGMEIIGLRFADAAEVQGIIEELYGVGESSANSQPEPRTSSRRRSRRTPAPEATNTGPVSAGKEAKYIDKIMADTRTNSLIVLANEQGMEAVRELIAKLDVDATDNSRSQIHVVRLEQAKAQDVMDVLSRLSEGGGGSSGSSRPSTARTSRTPTPAGAQAAGNADGEFGAIAAFDSGMRIAHDEATNSLVIIASPEDFRVVKQVIDELDRVRKQVFVDAVILEIASDDSFDFSLGAHGPQSAGENSIGFVSGQLGASSFGLSQDLLSGLALGVFGSAVEVPLADGSSLSVPAFGIVLQAIKTYSGVEIVSNPNLTTLDNEEAKIVVGRKVPFPTNTTFNQLGQPIVTFTREDVAVSLELTPRINSENYVTLEVRVEVSAVEESDSALDTLASGGPITSKREVETVALVKDNQTIVLGGLVGTTETEVETKVPILGDVPLLGALFRGRRTKSTKSNLLVFLTPHIIEDESDMTEIMAIKEAQFREFRRRFYGKSREQAYSEMQDLLQYSMNIVDRESMYRGSVETDNVQVLGQVPADNASAIQFELDRDQDMIVPVAPDDKNVQEPPAPDDLAVPAPADGGQ